MLNQTMDALKSILSHEKIALSLDGIVTVSEKSKGASLQSIKLITGSNAFSLKFDLCSFPGENTLSTNFPFLRRCDSIIFCLHEATPYILCVELKSSEPNRHEVAEQLRSAHCFLDYLDSLLKHYCKLDGIKNWSKLYFVFHKDIIPLNKTTIVTHSLENTVPEKALFLPVRNNDTHYLRKLIGKPL